MSEWTSERPTIGTRTPFGEVSAMRTSDGVRMYFMIKRGVVTMMEEEALHRVMQGSGPLVPPEEGD